MNTVNARGPHRGAYGPHIDIPLIIIIVIVVVVVVVVVVAI